MSISYRDDMYRIIGKRVFLQERLIFEAKENEEIALADHYLIISHNGKYNIYIPTDDNLYCIFKDVIKYEFDKGVLWVIKDNKCIMIYSAYGFAEGLNLENLSIKKSKLPQVPISNPESIELINPDSQCSIFNIDGNGYCLVKIDNEIIVKKLGGKLEKLPIFYHFKLIKEKSESFIFWTCKKVFGEFTKIEKFKKEDYPMQKGYHGYWGKDENDNICGLYIGGEKGYSEYEFTITFDKPVQEVKFFQRHILGEEKKCAIDIWKVNSDGEEKFIFQMFGNLNEVSLGKNKTARFVISKENFLNC